MGWSGNGSRRHDDIAVLNYDVVNYQRAHRAIQRPSSIDDFTAYQLYTAAADAVADDDYDDD